MRRRTALHAACWLAGVACLTWACGEQAGGPSPSPGSERTAFPIDWEALSNPLLSDPDIPLKDPCVVYHRGVFHIFASGASYRTRDFKTFEGPFEGHGSPDVTRLGDGRFVMVHQTRDLENPGPGPGVDPDGPDNRHRRLVFRTSTDLVTWSDDRELFPALPPDRNIDGALAWHGGRYSLGFKTGVTLQRFNVARSEGPDLDGRWTGPEKAHAGEGCWIDKLLPIIGDNITRWAENYQFVRIDGAWRMIATGRHPDRPIDFGYMGSHEPFIYALSATGDTLEDWTDWVGKRWLQVPEQAWNTLMHANSAYLADWREHDGYFYLFYAGTDEETADGRGHGRIGAVRSRDLVEWFLPGAPGRAGPFPPPRPGSRPRT